MISKGSDDSEDDYDYKTSVGNVLVLCYDLHTSLIVDTDMENNHKIMKSKFLLKHSNTKIPSMIYSYQRLN